MKMTKMDSVANDEKWLLNMTFQQISLKQSSSVDEKTICSNERVQLETDIKEELVYSGLKQTSQLASEKDFQTWLCLSEGEKLLSLSAILDKGQRSQRQKEKPRKTRKVRSTSQMTIGMKWNIVVVKEAIEQKATHKHQRVEKETVTFNMEFFVKFSRKEDEN